MPSSTFVDLVKCQVLSSGTDPFTLGPPVEGFRGAAVLIDGKTYSYSVQQGARFEFGRGVYTQSSGTLSRAVLGSSRNGQPEAFGVGAIVTFTLLAADLEAFSPVDPIVGVSIVAPDLGFTFDVASFIDGVLILSMAGRLTEEGGGVPAGGINYRINVPVIAAPTSSEIVGLDVSDVAYSFPADFEGSRVYVGTAAAATTVFSIDRIRSGVLSNIGSVTIEPDGSFAFATDGGTIQYIAAGDAVRITAPATPDAALANFAIKLVGSI